MKSFSLLALAASLSLNAVPGAAQDKPAAPMDDAVAKEIKGLFKKAGIQATYVGTEIEPDSHLRQYENDSQALHYVSVVRNKDASLSMVDYYLLYDDANGNRVYDLGECKGYYAEVTNSKHEGRVEGLEDFTAIDMDAFARQDRPVFLEAHLGARQFNGPATDNAFASLQVFQRVAANFKAEMDQLAETAGQARAPRTGGMTP